MGTFTGIEKAIQDEDTGVTASGAVHGPGSLGHHRRAAEGRPLLPPWCQLGDVPALWA